MHRHASARELVERGRVLPALARDECGTVALWRPVVQGPDVVTLNSLVTAMPPVCRAEQGEHDAHELATSALRGMLDAAVRAALPAGTELLSGEMPDDIEDVFAGLGLSLFGNVNPNWTHCDGLKRPQQARGEERSAAGLGG